MATKKATMPTLHTKTGNVVAIPVVNVDEDGSLSSSGGGALTRHLMATNGDVFPDDSETTYTYDESGLNIATITKTTSDGRVYKQTWTRSGSQLGSKSGWVRQ